jgi:elongation factor 2
MIKPVLMINKIDRAILELQVNGEEMYQNFLRFIENVNVIVATYEDEKSGMGESLQIDP